MQIRWHRCWLLALAVSACTLNPQPELPVAPAAPSDNPGSAGSRNGVVKNGERVTHAVVVDGDVLEIGHSFFVFVAQDPEPAVTRADP